MMRFGSHLLGLDQGELQIFTHYDTGGKMWTGKGDRMVRQRVAFSTPFWEVPAVIIGIAMLDTDHAANLRVDARAENIDQRGFDAVLSTWGDTRIAQARLSWTALGEMKHEEDWQL